MSTTQDTKPQPITRDRWTEIVARHALPLRKPRLKRRHHRYHTLGSARLTFMMHSADREPPVERRCKVTQLSGEGLTLRSPERIPLRTQLAIELCLEELPCHVSGQVIHCTGTVGAYKVGVALRFAEP